MWKYITRNVRETLERRICNSLTDSGQEKNSTCRLKEALLPTLHQFCNKRNFQDKQYKFATSDEKKEGKSQEHSWSDAYARHCLLGAIGWSTVFVLSWNLLQPLTKLQFAYKKEPGSWNEQEKSRHCVWSKQTSSRFCGGRAKPWQWKDDNQNHSHWSIICYRSRKPKKETNNVWPSVLNSKGENDDLVKNCNNTDSGHSSLQHEGILNSNNAKFTVPQNSNYSGIWKILSQTVWALPTHIVSKPTKRDIDIKLPPEDIPDYGPQTAEQALDDAAAKFMETQNTVLGDIDNSFGVELMEQGKHHEAVSRFTRAVGFSNPSAAYNLAVCYEMGLGTKQDFHEAAKYYQLASHQGHPAAMYNLGVFYVHGWGGLTSDVDEAQKLFEKASALGQKEAKKALDMVNSEIAPQIPQDSRPIANENVQQLMGLVEDFGPPGIYKNISSDLKDISDMVHESILKYTSMLQK